MGPSGHRRTAVTVLLLFGGAMLTRDLHYALTHPYWLDESWVAISTRLPIDSAPTITSSSPIGWTLLLRAASWLPGEPLRIVPMLFGSAAVPIAWWSTRQLSCGKRDERAVLVAIGVALSPALLLRTDLKHYTADIAVTLLLMGLAARATRDSSARSAVTLAVAGSASALVSQAAILVTPAALGALVVDASMRRDQPALLRRLAASVIAAVLLGGYYLTVLAPNLREALADYWTAYYLTADLSLLSEIGARYAHFGPSVGGGVWVLWYLLALVGLWDLWRRGDRVIPLATALLILGMTALAIAGRYPFLDHRTSAFVAVWTSWLAAWGLWRVLDHLAATRSMDQTLLTLTGLALLLAVGGGHLRAKPLPAEDIESQIDHVLEHRSAGDVVLVNNQGGWGLSYYWGRDDLLVDFHAANATGFMTQPEDPSIILAEGRTGPEIIEAAERAAAMVAPGGTVWVILTHLVGDELTLWSDSLDRLGDIIEIPVGVEPLRVLIPASSGS